MATGNSDDVLARLKSLVPPGWFSFVAPVRDAVLGGIADSAAWNFALLAAAKAQSRLATATGYFLDIAASDFFGLGFLRRPNEGDDSYRARIAPEIFRERVTRAGLRRISEIETGATPIITELWNTGDTGAWDVSSSLAWGGAATPAVIVSGWDCAQSAWDSGSTFAFATPSKAIASSAGAGLWGSTDHPFQVFMTVIRPVGQGIPLIAGWDTTNAGWDVGPIEWVSTDPTGVVSDADIYASIAATAAAGVTIWVRIINPVTGSDAPQAADGALDWSIPGNPIQPLFFG